MARKLIVELIGDDRSLRQALSRSTKGTKDFQNSAGAASRGALAASGAFSSMGRSIAFASGGFLTGAGLVAGLKQSYTAASNLAEQTAKSNVVFDKSAKIVINYSKHALGLAQDQALETASSIGSLLRPLNISSRESAKFSVQLTKMGTDLSSFYNTDVSDSLAAIRSGIVGEMEPLRRYGIILSETRVKAEALSMGLAKGAVDLGKVRDANMKVAIAQAQYNDALKKYGPNSTQVAQATLRLHGAQEALTKVTKGANVELSQHDKVLARISLIQKDAKLAAGDYARTIGGAANQQREFQKNLRNTEILIGQALLPTVKELLSHLNKWLSNTENQKKVQETFKTILDGIVTVGKTLGTVIKNVDKVTGGFANTLKIIVGLAIISKLRGIAVALGLVGAGGGTGGITGAAGAATKAVRGLRTVMVSLWSAQNMAGLRGVKSELGNILKNLGTLGKIGAAGIIVGVTVEIYEKLIPDFKGKHYSGIDLARDALGAVGIGGGAGGGKPKGHGTGSGLTGERAGGSKGKTSPEMRNAVQLPTTFRSTHDTSGIAGVQPSIDVPVRSGQAVLAPEDGQMYRKHFIPYSPGLGGWTCYFIGKETGNTYFLTHFGSLGREGFYRRGQVMGYGGRSVNAPHVHEGIVSRGGGAMPISNNTTAGGVNTGVGALSVGSSSAATKVWKGATQATITTAKASVTAMISAAKQVIGGMAGPMSDIEKSAIKHLQSLREHLKIHMSAADLANTKAQIAKWGKVLNDEVAKQTKAAKRAFDLAAKQLMRAFDKETERGLASRAAPDETPTEKILRQRDEARSDQQRAQALTDAQASGDAQAIADALYDIETAGLEKQAHAERVAADKQADDAQTAYKEQREDQREALDQQLSDWEEWLTNKRRTWNEFWNWIRANPQGGAIAPPNMGETKTAPGFGTKKPTYSGGFTQVGQGNGGWTLVPSGASGGQGPPRMALGGIVTKPTLAVIGEKGPEAVIPLGRFGNGTQVLDITVNLDGATIYRNQKKHAARDVTRNGSTGV